MSTIRRSIRPNAVKFASNGEVVGARQVLAIVSSEQRDRMGDVILQDGIDYSDFLRGGGTVLWQHDANYPVARTVRLSVVNGCLTALAQFPPEGTSEKSDECYRLIRDGVVNSTSIGFMPVDWEFIDRNRPGSGVLFREIQMLEFSYVSVPANPGALVIAKSIGATRSPATPPEKPPLHYAGTLAQRQAQAEYGTESVERRRRIARALACAVGTDTWISKSSTLRSRLARQPPMRHCEPPSKG